MGFHFVLMTTERKNLELFDVGRKKWSVFDGKFSSESVLS